MSKLDYGSGRDLGLRTAAFTENHVQFRWLRALTIERDVETRRGAWCARDGEPGSGVAKTDWDFATRRGRGRFARTECETNAIQINKRSSYHGTRVRAQHVVYLSVRARARPFRSATGCWSHSVVRPRDRNVIANLSVVGKRGR